MEGKDKLGNLIDPSMIVDISETMTVKEEMLCCHTSQRDWLLKHHGMDEYVYSMKSFSEKRGKMSGVKYGEGFRQHLGHSFPQDNILKRVLNDIVYII